MAPVYYLCPKVPQGPSELCMLLLSRQRGDTEHPVSEPISLESMLWKPIRWYRFQLKFIEGAGDAVDHLYITSEIMDCPRGLSPLAFFLLGP